MRLVPAALVALVLLAGFQASAQQAGPAKPAREAQRKPPAEPRAWILYDSSSRRIVSANDADTVMQPASLTKLMTLYILFSEIDAGRISKSDRIVFSPRAAEQRPTRLGVAVGDSITVDLAIRSTSVRSANDVAVAIAEKVSGSVPSFVDRMNAEARRLGMRATRFTNPSGLPNPDNVSTARDMLTLSLAIRSRFPEHADYFSLRSFEYAGRTFAATNHLLGTYRGADGMKTGFINATGFSVAASAERDGRRLYAVSLGSNTSAERNSFVASLFDRGFGSTPAKPRQQRPTAARQQR
jgi:D-alanyl-D-alanine carboxypeptidase